MNEDAKSGYNLASANIGEGYKPNIILKLWERRVFLDKKVDRFKVQSISSLEEYITKLSDSATVIYCWKGFFYNRIKAVFYTGGQSTMEVEWKVKGDEEFNKSRQLLKKKFDKLYIVEGWPK